MYDQRTIDQKQRAYHIVDEQKIDLAVICETWLRNRDDAWCICSILNNDGYVLVTQDSLKNRRGGGLAVTLKGPLNISTV